MHIAVESGERAAEASTLLNLALAHWQLDDSDRAYESYLHAYRAAESPSTRPPASVRSHKACALRSRSTVASASAEQYSR